MKFSKRSSIKYKLVLIIVLVTFISVFVGFSIDILQETAFLKEQLVNESMLNAKLIAEYCIAPLDFGYKDEAESILSKLATIPFIYNAFLFDANGDIFAAYNRNDTITPPNIPKADIYNKFEENYLHVFRTITLKDDVKGTIFLNISTAGLKNKLHNHLLSVVFLSFAIILLAYFLAIAMQKIISHPILTLADFAHQISQSGDYSSRIKKINPDEIGILYDSFNNMLNQIEQRDADLSENEENLRITLNSIGDAVISTDLEGKIVRLNPIAAKMTGWTLKSAKGKNILEVFNIFNALTGEKVSNPVTKVLDSRRIVGLANHTKLISRTGKEYQIADSGAPILDTQGNIKGVVLVFRDVTDDYKIREKLKNSENRLKEAQRLTKIGNWELDHRTGKLEWSNEIYKIFEIDKEKFEGSYEFFLDMIHPDDRERVHKTFQQSINEKSPYSIDHRLLMKSGQVKYVNELCENFFDDDGKPQVSIGTIHDITDRKKIEIELRDSEQRFRNVMENLPGALFAHDLDGNIIMVNEMTYAITGYTRNELLKMKVSDIDPMSVSRQDNEKLWQNLKSGEAYVIESQHKRKDGSFYDAEIRLNALKLKGKQIILSIAIDISERKKAEQERKKLELQLQQSQKLEAIGTLVGGIAHDFNNILTPIMGYADLLKYSLEKTNPYYDSIEEILSASVKAKNLIEQLLTFSRKKKQDISPINIAPVVKNVIKFLRSSLPASIKISLDINENIGNIMGNATQIHQIIMNLCINASHAMEKEDGSKRGQLIIGLKQVNLDEKSSQYFLNLKPGKYVHLVIEDDGKGMSQATLSHIFEPFFTTKEEGKGTGMGLSVVHGIVKSYKGEIKVYSDLETGTTFNIYFPATIQSVVPKKIKLELDYQFREEKIFIVDDRKYITDLLKKLLSPYIKNIVISNDSLQALKILKEDYKNYDLLITDLTMPDMSGLELVRELRNNAIMIPIILLTGHGHNIKKEDQKAAGINAVIHKPVLMEELIATIKNIFKNKD